MGKDDTPKRHGGRPRLAADERRDERLPNLRVTAAERAYVEEQAARAGLPLVEFCRRAILSKRIKPRPALVEDAVLLELNRLGVNLNQIARAINRGRGIPADMADTMAAIKEAVTRLAKDGS
ncbi:MobC family plasmid mobilization relaxosome protein [Hoeflea sp. EC-HK425]|uniref:MobC family plasmid mobilization relaxosome protein n=1 Tax=Hoeflea sp. EC-HK425 TaxID=2038388 RepID=UPI001259C44B|nr:MobC family plasmid mobilization relaxosome protein [Hoeflea sp. EC-HK425]VVS99872.1 Mobilisation protein (MobC) [Hoeflea sp. EC-HK425]